MEGDFIEEDVKDVPQEYKQIYLPIDNKLNTPFFYSIKNFSYNGLSFRDLQIIKSPGEKNKITYSLKKSGDKIVKTIVDFRIDDICVKEDYSDHFRIRLKKEIIFECIKSISFYFIEKRKQVITPIILRAYMNYFDNEITKEEYNNIIGINDERFINFSSHINSYGCTFVIPFFSNEDKSLSFPQHLSDYVPEYEMIINQSILDIIEVENLINGSWVRVSSKMIDGKLDEKTKKIKKPNISVCYGLLTKEEKQASICGDNVDDDTKVYYKDFRELNVDIITYTDERVEEGLCFKLLGDKCLGLIFYGPENAINNISCFNINKDNKVCMRFENMTYSKSDKFQNVSFKRKNTLEKNKFIAFTFCSDVASVDSQAVVDLAKYGFNIVLNGNFEMKDITCVGIFLNYYTISKNNGKILIQ